MAYICPWPYMVSYMDRHASMASANNESFAQIVSNANVVQHKSLPILMIKEDSLCIKISQHVYEQGLVDFKRKLHGRLVLNKGDKPYQAKEVSLKLSKMWKTSHPWRMISLGRGFFKFTFGFNRRPYVGLVTWYCEHEVSAGSAF